MLNQENDKLTSIVDDNKALIQEQNESSQVKPPPRRLFGRKPKPVANGDAVPTGLRNGGEPISPRPPMPPSTNGPAIGLELDRPQVPPRTKKPKQHVAPKPPRSTPKVASLHCHFSLSLNYFFSVNFNGRQHHTLYESGNR